jgi:sulfatase maturation enzyme AslB (radical SAM superfamily)
MTAEDYRSVMRQAFALGCRNIQFIGGEPQLNINFHDLLVEAKAMGFSFIEVFTNLTRLKDETLRFAADNNICFATSVYSSSADTHDAITKVRSSHQRTIGNLGKLIGEGVTTRAAVIVIDQDKDDVARTEDYLRGMGVKHVRHAATQAFGRGQDVLDSEAKMTGLCGHCWNGKLCVAPDGDAYPCVMARQWPVGNVLKQPLAQIMSGEALETTRQVIFNDVWLPKLAAIKKPAKGKKKKEKSKKDTPIKCVPYEKCAPELHGAEKAKKGGKTDKGKEGAVPVSDCMPCPQSCVPIDGSTCGPMSCPQSCTPFIVVCQPTGKE